MESKSKPMTLLSMDSVFGQMSIEKIWEIRRKNRILKQITEEVPYKQTRKWKISRINVEGGCIAPQWNTEHQVKTLMKGTKQTKWVSPEVLCIVDSNADVLQKSILPVSSTFCRRIKSIVVTSSKQEPEEYLLAIFKLTAHSPNIFSLCLHIPNITEDQLFQAWNSFNSKEIVKTRVAFGVSASTELTPKFIREFCVASGMEGTRLLLVKNAEIGEVETPKREAILEFFKDHNIQKYSKRGMFFDYFNQEIARSIVSDLEVLYAAHHKTYYVNGSLIFNLETSAYCAQVEFLPPIEM